MITAQGVRNTHEYNGSSLGHLLWHWHRPSGVLQAFDHLLHGLIGAVMDLDEVALRRTMLEVEGQLV